MATVIIEPIDNEEPPARTAGAPAEEQEASSSDPAPPAPAEETPVAPSPAPAAKKRGRPKGSMNKPKAANKQPDEDVHIHTLKNDAAHKNYNRPANAADPIMLAPSESELETRLVNMLLQQKLNERNARRAAWTQLGHMAVRRA